MDDLLSLTVPCGGLLTSHTPQVVYAIADAESLKEMGFESMLDLKAKMCLGTMVRCGACGASLNYMDLPTELKTEATKLMHELTSEAVDQNKLMPRQVSVSDMRAHGLGIYRSLPLLLPLRMYGKSMYDIDPSLIRTLEFLYQSSRMYTASVGFPTYITSMEVDNEITEPVVTVPFDYMYSRRRMNNLLLWAMAVALVAGALMRIVIDG